jgi:hypothetical protein
VKARSPLVWGLVAVILLLVIVIAVLIGRVTAPAAAPPPTATPPPTAVSTSVPQPATLTKLPITSSGNHFVLGMAPQVVPRAGDWPSVRLANTDVHLS